MRPHTPRPARTRVALLAASTSAALIGCEPDGSAPADTDKAARPEAPAAPSDAAWARDYVEGMQASLNKNPDMAQINALEQRVALAEAEVLRPWAAAFRAKDGAAFAALLQGPEAGLRWASGGLDTVREREGLREQRWSPAPGPDEAAAYLAELARVDHIALDVVDLEEQPGGTLALTLRYDLRGERLDGGRRQDRGFLGVELSAGPQPRVLKITPVRLERVESGRAPAFQDATAAWGLDQLPVSDRKEAIRRGGYALVVADIDGDARPDMLVGQYGPLQLLRNTGSGYDDITAKAGLAGEGTVKAAAFADLDGDGDRDIVLLRFVVGETDPRGDFVVYENRGDTTFSKREGVLPRRRHYDRAMPLTLADFNNDGKIDVYIGFPGIRDFTSGISGRARPEWLASQGIWFNEGGWAFREAAEGETVTGENDVYAHAAVSTDIDNDGHIDLLVVDDSGRFNPVYRNNGQGGFAQITEQAGMGRGGLSMGIAAGDFNGDGLIDVMSSNITMTAGQRMATATEGLLPPESRAAKVMETLRAEYTALTLYQNMGDGTFKDVTAATPGLEWAGDAAAAGEWIDYNHDGLLDYYLPNGLWSSGEGSLDSLFFRSEIAAYGDAILGYATRAPDTTDPMPNDVHGRPIFATNGGPNPVLSVLRHHRPTDGAALTWSLSGGQRNALFRNNGDGSFTEVGYLEGADRVEDGYIVAQVDVDADGLQDLVLRNTDPAPEHDQRPVIALRNTLPGSALTVRVRAANGNTDGLGMKIRATVGGKTLLREIRSVNGAIQAEPTAVFGLGGAKQVDVLEISWPNGERQVLRSVSAGVLELRQGG